MLNFVYLLYVEQRTDYGIIEKTEMKRDEERKREKMNRFRDILRNLFVRDRAVTPEAISSTRDMSDRDIRLLRMVGATYNELLAAVNETTAVNYERSSLYREIERAQSHWMMGAAVDLFADYSTPHNTVTGHSIWPMAKDTKYMRVLSKFIDELELEEKVYDWAATTGGFGDMFVEVNGHPGLGIVSIDDSSHPSAISRIDYDGVLLGFYKTPFDTGGMASSASESEALLLPPWQFVHFRLLGASKRRPSYTDPSGGIEHRTIYLMGADSKQVSTKYGTSLLFNGIPVYKRLRLAEDALLLARLTRGIMRYIYKIKVDSCLRGDTLIRFADGSFCSIQDMVKEKEKYVGKEVLTVDPKTGEIKPNKVFDVYETRKNAVLLRVYLSNNKHIDCTPDHLFLLKSGEYVEAQTLNSGDELMSVDKDLIKVDNLQPLCTREDTYDITITNTPNFSTHAGVFLHNSNPEAGGQLVQEYMNILKHARAIDSTGPGGNDSFESKANQMCLRGDTEIRLCTDEDISIRDLVENKEKYVGKYVWSVNEDFQIEPTKITAAMKTRPNAELVRVHLDNGEYVDCTPDHRFMMRDGSYVEARDLRPLDLLQAYGGLDKNSYTAHLKKICYVLEIEQLEEKEDTYDITVEKNHNFSLSSGIFVHNSSIEDLFVPVFGETGDVAIEKIGGEPDIKWVVDVEELRNQLACSLRVPLSLLGGYVQEASGQLGSEAIEQLDIRFARSSKRLQRALCAGVKRLCQIHLAYLGMDPDPRLFEIQMGENSTAEEQLLKDALETSTDVVEKFMSMVDNLGVEVDKIAVMDYLNRKVLKLNDFDLRKFIKTPSPVASEERAPLNMEDLDIPIEGAEEEPEAPEAESPIVVDHIKREFYSYLPLNENMTSSVLSSMNESEWKTKYQDKSVKIKLTEVKK